MCFHAALSNGVLAEEQKETIAAYCREMNIPEIVPRCYETIDDIDLGSLIELDTGGEVGTVTKDIGGGL